MGLPLIQAMASEVHRPMPWHSIHRPPSHERRSHRCTTLYISFAIL
jgi:hypothetical protein